MTIAYTAPLARAWERVRRNLFARFDLEKWLVLGFAAFLGGLVDTGFGRGAQLRWSHPWRAENWTEWTVLLGAHSEPGATLPFLLAPLAILGLAILAALLWVSSRSKFVFLDGLLRDRGEWTEPWHRFKQLGQSLFVWRLGYWLAGILLATLSISPWFGILGSFTRDQSDGGIWILPSLFLAFTGVLVAALLAITGLFLESFIVPIMYRHNLTTQAAWRHFLPLLRRYPADFVGYTLVVVLLWLFVLISLMFIVTVTCCLALPLVAFPFVSSVTLLPISALFRLYSVEFLSQFGPVYFGDPSDETPRESL